ncbi:hypothetical protein FRB99_000250 [Tulasnella sp. 403]|nr:hypothetical protein FRB99_000250 [Tulasnella sp. 403]
MAMSLASSVATKGERPKIKLTVHEEHQSPQESEEANEDMAYEQVFERIITLLEKSSSKYFDQRQARDVIAAVAHRVVHGGTETEPMNIYPGHTQGLDKLDVLSQFAPLHNHRAVQVIKFCLKALPGAYQILCFDTLFHSTLPEHIYTYPLTAPSIPPPIPLRKYGAHGLSYAYILRTTAKHLNKREDELNLIVAHLGSGASVCAIKDGKSIDTSMGLTPLEGIVGGTRTGSIDPVLIFHHTPSASETVDFNGFPVAKGEMIMNKEGGIQAVCGTSNFGSITSQLSTSHAHRLAYDIFLDRLLNYVGAYLLKILGSASPPPPLHGIVFSGGIGEKSAELRADVGKHLAWLGCSVDDRANREGAARRDSPVAEITTRESRVKMFVCLTDEETQSAAMALETIKEKDH